MAINRGIHGFELVVNWKKMLEIQPFLNHANFWLTRRNVNSKTKVKRRRSRAEQARIYQRLFESGKVKSKADLARKFRVSRAWVTKVLS